MTQARFFVTILFFIACPEVHAMTSAQTRNDFAAAQTQAAADLKTISADFNFSIRDRLATDDSAALLTAEVETLPSLEVTRPWVLHPLEPSLDVVDRESVSTVQSAELVPSNGSRDRRRRF